MKNLRISLLTVVAFTVILTIGYADCIQCSCALVSREGYESGWNEGALYSGWTARLSIYKSSEPVAPASHCWVGSYTTENAMGSPGNDPPTIHVRAADVNGSCSMQDGLRMDAHQDRAPYGEWEPLIKQVCKKVGTDEEGM
jgi:hypothetical protein